MSSTSPLLRVLLCLALLGGLGTASHAQTLDEIITRHVEAIGGVDAWREIKTLRLSGQAEFGPQSAPLTVEFLRPGKIRIEFALQGLAAVRAWNGEDGWAVMPVTGQTEAVDLAPDEAQTVAKLADFEGPYIDWEAKGFEIELAGPDELDGRPVWALGVTYPDGFEMISFIDRETYYEVGQMFAFLSDGEDVRITTLLGDHREEGDVVIAHSQTTEIEGAQAAPPQVLRFEKVEINPEGISADRFERP